jgi:hypothetical protein
MEEAGRRIGDLEEVRRWIEEAADELAECLSWCADREEAMECIDEFLKEVSEAIEGYMTLWEREEGENAAGEQEAPGGVPQVRQARA